MSYLISDINRMKPQSGFIYLFDANIWLAILDITFSRRELVPHIKFFNSIISEDIVKDAFIGVPSVLLSEVINRMVKDIHYKEFCIKNTPSPSHRNHFKDIYRKSTDYKTDIEAVCSSIRQYHKKIKFLSDNLDKYSCKDLIKKIPTYLDTNATGSKVTSRMINKSNLGAVINRLTPEFFDRRWKHYFQTASKYSGANTSLLSSRLPETCTG